MTLHEIKATCTDKQCQGDVNLYFLPKDPGLDGERVVDPVLVYGNSGNHHRLEGREGEHWKAIKTKDGQFVVTILKPIRFVHEQHVPPLMLGNGFILFDRAREKGMFDDMINPVAD